MRIDKDGYYHYSVDNPLDKYNKPLNCTDWSKEPREKKQFHLKIKWKNREKTEAIEIVLYDDGQPLCELISVDDARLVRDVLNEQEEQIKELETRNKRQYDLLKKLSDLMYKRDWKSLEKIVEDWEESDRLLQAEFKCYDGDVE